MNLADRLGVSWTRRAVLAGAAAAAAGTLFPSASQSVSSSTEMLRALARACTEADGNRAVGSLCFPNVSAARLESRLMAHISAPTPEALRAAGRVDLAAGDTITIGGRSLTRSEALFLALGDRLRREPSI